MLLDNVCRFYQRLFPEQLAEANELVALHAKEDKSAYLAKYFEHELKKGQASVQRFLALNRDWVGGRVLDFGCGAGGLTFALRAHATSAVGIDLEEYKLAYAREQAVQRGIADIDFLCYPGDKVPLQDQSFNCVFCVDVMEHLPRPAESLAEMWRLLKPGGMLLVSFGPPWGHPHGKHTWTRLPGWWSHLIFPQSVCMRTIGQASTCTWEELGLHRLTIRKFRRLMRTSGFEQLHLQFNIQRFVKPLKYVPLVRELFIAEAVGIYRKPA